MHDSNDGMIEIKGLRFFYREWPCRSNDSRDQLVLLHGASGNVASWEPIAAGLQEKFDLLAIDLRGHGYSSWDPDGDYSARTMADDVSKIISAFNFNSYSLIGHSMGGRVAIALAENPPAGLRRLVIEDIRPQPHSLMGVPRQERFASFEEAISMFLESNPNALAEAQAWAKRLMRTEDGALTWQFDRVMRDPNVDRGHMSAEEAWSSFLNITVPTLVIRGETSELLKANEADDMAASGQNCRLVTIPNAGHRVHGDQPDAFLEAVMPFLLKQDSR